ncbi:hypothetical protein ACHAXR_010645 [Thalassiosira sp. AJA248-18]
MIDRQQQIRLETAKRSVQHATRQAYAALISSNETIFLANNKNRHNSTATKITADDDANNNIYDNDNLRAGMDRGLSLFGTSTSYKQQLEMEFNEKLRQVEEDLVDIQSGLNREEDDDNYDVGEEATPAMTMLPRSHDDDDDEESSSYSDNDNNNSVAFTSSSSSSSSSRNDISKLQRRITFLQKCSRAHKLLEKVDVLSLSTNFATASVATTAGSSGSSSTTTTTTPRGGGGAVFPYFSSPSSLLGSPANFGQLTFKSTSPHSGSVEGGGGGGKTTNSPLVQAAKLVKQTEEILDGITNNSWKQEQQCSAGGDGDVSGNKENTNANNNDDHEQQRQTFSPTSTMTNMCMDMLTELRHQTRRKKMELRHRAWTLVEGCVVVDNAEKRALLVCGSGTTITNNTTVVGESCNMKGVESDNIGASPISMATATPNNHNSMGNVSPAGPLSDAYQVLHLFSDSNSNSIPSTSTSSTFGESLDGAMKQLSNKLYVGIIKPCLHDLWSQEKRCSSSKNTRAGGGGGGDDVEKSRMMGYFKFTHASLRSGAIAGSGCDRKYDPVSSSIKGPAVRLHWTLTLVTTMNDGDATTTTSNNNNNEAVTNTFVTTAKEINQKTLLQSSSSSNATNTNMFLTALNFLTNLFSFLHEHVLLSRSDLSSMLGKHLFGTYGAMSSSIASGSALLGGGATVVGAAAAAMMGSGVGEGGDNECPLMAYLLDSMRRLCIPKEESTPHNIWKVLCEMEHRLVLEVGEFENKMVELGLMKGVSSMYDAGRGGNAPAPTALSSLSSPTGLSVLLNNDTSPIQQNDSTLSNLSTTLDTSFPRTHSSNNLSKKIILSCYSPLSELAHSLHQAYIENQRSNILHRGQSILLSTDYHNTVQAGVFVPDPPSGDTMDFDYAPIRKLENVDPLSSTFAFHQCSISTTARQLLDLCRGTLEDATRDYYDHPGELQAAAANVEYLDDHLDKLRPMLYRTSRELFDLFRAIVPTVYASEVGSIPRMAGVLHNDCVFLAHECLLLGAEYKSKFRRLFCNDNFSSPSEKTRLLGEVCTFVDMVPPFRDLATRSMGHMTELQKGQLYELVNPRLANFQQSVASNESVTEWDDADMALRAALYHLRHLSQAWKRILSRSVYHMSMGNLVDVVFTLFLDPVLKAEDITEPASRFVHSLFLDMAQGAAEMFLVGGEMPDNDGNETNSAMQHCCFQLAKRYTTTFDKSQVVGQFMCMRLDEIQRGLEEGVFRSVTAKELSHLIAAVFDDGDKRTTLLNALASK